MVIDTGQPLNLIGTSFVPSPQPMRPFGYNIPPPRTLESSGNGRWPLDRLAANLTYKEENIMSTYTDQIFGRDPGYKGLDLSAQLAAALEEQRPKKKGGKKYKKKLKKLEKQIQVLALDHQLLMELEKKLHKQKKGKKGKGKKKLKKQLRALELQRQQRPWWQDAMTVSISKLLDLMIASKSGQTLKPQPPRALRSQHSLALPPHLD